MNTRKIICLIFLFLIFSACTPRLKFVLNDTEVMEYGTDPISLIKENNADKITIYWKDASGRKVKEEELKLNTEYNLIFEIEKGGQHTVIEKTIILQDTSAPVLTVRSNELILEYGDEFDAQRWFAENVSVSDNYSLQDDLIIQGLDHLNSETDGEITLSVIDESGNCAEAVVKVSLQDTIGPIITAKKTEFTIKEKENAPDFLSYVSAYDIKDKETEVLIENTYDTNKAGIYSLIFVAYDTVGNRTELSFTLTVEPIFNENLSEPSFSNEPSSATQAPSTTTNTTPEIDIDYFIQDQRELDSCIALGKQSDSHNWECLSNGDGTYTFVRYD